MTAGRGTVLRGLAVLLLLALAACGTGGGRGGASTALECAPYARQVSGIPLHGQAYTWWDQAAGRYPRGNEPVPGGVLVFRRSARLPYGHVSVVRSVRSAREITVTHANWVHHRIGEDEPVVDVSPGNDWSLVRVWWAPVQALGSSTYAAYGFIAPGRVSLGPMASAGP